MNPPKILNTTLYVMSFLLKIHFLISTSFFHFSRAHLILMTIIVGGCFQPIHAFSTHALHRDRRTRCNSKENIHKMGQQTFKKGNLIVVFCFRLSYYFFVAFICTFFSASFSLLSLKETEMQTCYY